MVHWIMNEWFTWDIIPPAISNKKKNGSQTCEPQTCEPLHIFNS